MTEIALNEYVSTWKNMVSSNTDSTNIGENKLRTLRIECYPPPPPPQQTHTHTHTHTEFITEVYIHVYRPCPGNGQLFYMSFNCKPDKALRECTPPMAEAIRFLNVNPLSQCTRFVSP